MNSPSLDELQRVEALLMQPTRACGLRHEDSSRDAMGNVLFEREEGDDPEGSDFITLHLIPECSADLKHMGCPHFAQAHGETLLPPLRILAEHDPECADALTTLESMFLSQQVVDVDVRDARLGSALDRRAAKFPTLADGTNAAKPHLERFEANCAAIDVMRLRLLRKVRTAITELLSSKLEDGKQTA